MGYFGYICNGCKTSIRGGEVALLKHIRHGEFLGETMGYYNMYGGVEENNEYRGHHDGINGHMSIHRSEFGFLDSKHFKWKHYKDRIVTWLEYRSIKVNEGVEDLSEEIYEEWRNLEPYQHTEPPQSGTEAWHAACYFEASEEIKNQHILSESDPYQATGQARKKYVQYVV